ncbi:TetR/AcrR family transcriptional regulator [Pseudomonas fluorescens]|nr:TetR/AcrR family transcriptional regulator [Pseudomonas fluorescens]
MIKRPPIDVLKKVMEDALKNGFAFRSLRAIAETSGISHRMLIYHFGSQEGLWSAIINQARQSEKLFFDENTVQVKTPADLRAFFESVWRRYTSQEFLPFYQLHFEIYSYALRHKEECAEFLEGVVIPWSDTLAKLFEKVGFSAKTATVRARLVLAATRGYHLDLITTGDKELVENSAFEMLDLICGP